MRLGRQCSAALSRYRVIAKIGDFLLLLFGKSSLASGNLSCSRLRRPRSSSPRQSRKLEPIAERLQYWRAFVAVASQIRARLGQTRTSDLPDRVASPPWLEFDYWDLDLQSTLLALCLELGFLEPWDLRHGRFGIWDFRCLKQRPAIGSSELGGELLDKLLNNFRALLFVPPKAGPTFGHGGRDRDICPTLRFSAQNSIAHVENSPRQVRRCHVSSANKPIVIEIV